MRPFVTKVQKTKRWIAYPSHVSHRLRRVLAFGGMAPSSRTSYLAMTEKLDYLISLFKIQYDSETGNGAFALVSTEAVPIGKLGARCL